ncbi:MAG: hypothetical protein GX682_05090 [Clostridiaceae bacterium]|nr:hypothetical protein [Clostridiaceae bacterium]
MEKKYYNESIVGNEKIVASFSKNGEMLRLFYPSRDCRQFIDTMHMGVKVNDSNLIYLHEDINNNYKQYYIENTNILNTEIKNTYFNLSIIQTDFAFISKDILVKKYVIENENTIDLDVDFIIYSKLLSSFNNMVGTKIEKNIFFQYSHNYTFSIFSKLPIQSYRLNNSREEVKSGNLKDKDYIAMANDSAVSFKVGKLESGEKKEFEIYIYINDNSKKYKFDEIIKEIEEIKKNNTNKELENVKKYWNKYVKEHDGLNILSEGNDFAKNNKFEDDKLKLIKNVYIRSILLFPLLLNNETGGISAALEVDEQRDKCGRYSYCWPRDAVFITNALDILNMTEETSKFYNIFSKQTQSDNGMWEQRFYTDGRLAPCWGYQIDETASIIFGIYMHYNKIKNKEFLKQNYDMCIKAIKFLKKYVEYITLSENESNEPNNIFETNESYDLWEMNEGIHLYSCSAIYAAFDSMIEINKQLELKNDQENEELKEYKDKIKQYCSSNFLHKETKTLKRNKKDEIADISILGAMVPFEMLNEKEEIVKNTVEKMKLTLRTYTGGYIRFENDSYIGGNNPWPIATLWMALYQIKLGEQEKAKKLIEFVVETATEHGFIAEQVDNQTMKSKWVIGLGWSHAMYIIALSMLK